MDFQIKSGSILSHTDPMKPPKYVSSNSSVFIVIGLPFALCCCSTNCCVLASCLRFKDSQCLGREPLVLWGGKPSNCSSGDTGTTPVLITNRKITNQISTAKNGSTNSWLQLDGLYNLRSYHTIGMKYCTLSF